MILFYFIYFFYKLQWEVKMKIAVQDDWKNNVNDS